MRATDDDFARARRALRQVDGELDLARLRAVAAKTVGAETTSSERGRSGADLDRDPLDQSAEFGVEILRTGQRPALPRRRATAWALAAAAALLCGAGVGTAVLWPEPGGTAPGSQLPASPAPWTSSAPDQAPDQAPAPDSTPTTGPRECDAPGPTPSAVPDRATDSTSSDTCDPVPVPSTRTHRAEP